MKKRIAILGCENSHAQNFLQYISENSAYSDIEVVGVYSNEPEAARALNEKYGVPVLANYADAVGLIDGLIITARHGALHYEYAKPYMDSRIPMFIDKPITVDEDEAVEFMRALQARGIRISGGSSLKHDVTVKELRRERENEIDGTTRGGIVRAPIDFDSVYGGFHFYAQHLVQTVLEIFGYNTRSVIATKSGDQTTVIFRYDGFDAVGVFLQHNYVYYACRFAEKSVHGGYLESTDDHNWFKCEFDEFYDVLAGKTKGEDYQTFIRPVFVMGAIMRSLENGKEEDVRDTEV